MRRSPRCPAMVPLLILVAIGLSRPAAALADELPAPPDPGEEAPSGGQDRAADAEEDGDRDADAAGRPVIGEVVVDGNVRVSDSAFFNNLGLKPGDPYDERRIREEFRRLWALNLFDEISVESRQRGAATHDLIFHVRDRPLVGAVTYVGMKAITETGILERLGQAKAEVRRGQPVDFSVLRRAEAAIEHMLGEKGYLQSRARARLSPLQQGQRDVTFYVREGGKTKIKKIDFVGNTLFSDRQLRKTLKLTKQAFWLTSWASSKPLYHPAKFDQDVEGIRTLYKSRGHLDLVLRPEVVELASEVERRRGRDGEAEPEPDRVDEEEPWEEPASPPPPPPDESGRERRKRLKAESKAARRGSDEPRRWVYLTVPIDEGRAFRVGTISMSGNTVFSDAEILARLPLRAGMVFNDSALKAGNRRLEEDYGERGYFYVSIDPKVEKHEAVADLSLEFTEDKRYYVGRIEFTGNTTTRDTVLRRELKLMEQNLFNVRLLRLGMRKIGQLGYWQVGSDPEVHPEPDAARVNIEVQGVEANRNEIQVGGGVSGIDGGFFQASYATRNFLGRGEIVSTFIQAGANASRYSINFTEPYFLGKPWTLGASLFRQNTDFSDFARDGTGGRVVVGRPLGNFTRFDVSYGYEEINFRPTREGFGPATTTTTSSVTTVYTIDTRNNFFHPTRGTRLQTSLEYAGGALGGDNYFTKLQQFATLYLPGLARRHYIGLNLSYGRVLGFGGQPVPSFERFYLGGERSLRVFPTRSVGPVRRDIDVDENGSIDFPEECFDLNGNFAIDYPEECNPDGVFQPCEDLDGDGSQDDDEFDWGNCTLDPTEDLNGNLILDCEDLNRNGMVDPGEDVNGNGMLDCEDLNRNGRLDFDEDRPDGSFTPFCPADDLNMNGLRDFDDANSNGARDPGELEDGDFGNCRLDSGEDTNGDGVFGRVFPGGEQFLLFNGEYTIPLSDTVEFALFYDAGNAFDDGEQIRFDDFRVDYGLEMRFYLPVFQAPLRLIYGIIQDPRVGEDESNFIFSIGTTF